MNWQEVAAMAEEVEESVDAMFEQADHSILVENVVQAARSIPNPSSALRNALSELGAFDSAAKRER